MSKEFFAAVIKREANVSGVAAKHTANSLVEAIVLELKRKGSFTLPSFGTFRVAKTPARTALNPKTQEKVEVKASKTVRFKCSPVLRWAVQRQKKAA